MDSIAQNEQLDRGIDAQNTRLDYSLVVCFVRLYRGPVACFMRLGPFTRILKIKVNFKWSSYLIWSSELRV